jgi:REP element-mobilizing transposase RayT
LKTARRETQPSGPGREGTAHRRPPRTKSMPNYRRLYVPGGTVFLAVVTHERRPLFKDPRNIERLRQAATTVMAEMPFAFEAAVVLHDHFHVLWSMPEGDTKYSKRMGRLKVEFTQSLHGRKALPVDVSASRRKHRESDFGNGVSWSTRSRTNRTSRITCTTSTTTPGPWQAPDWEPRDDGLEKGDFVADRYGFICPSTWASRPSCRPPSSWPPPDRTPAS